MLIGSIGGGLYPVRSFVQVLFACLDFQSMVQRNSTRQKTFDIVYKVISLCNYWKFSLGRFIKCFAGIRFNSVFHIIVPDLDLLLIT